MHRRLGAVVRNSVCRRTRSWAGGATKEDQFIDRISPTRSTRFSHQWTGTDAKGERLHQSVDHRSVILCGSVLFRVEGGCQKVDEKPSLKGPRDRDDIHVGGNLTESLTESKKSAEVLRNAERKSGQNLGKIWIGWSFAQDSQDQLSSCMKQTEQIPSEPLKHLFNGSIGRRIQKARNLSKWRVSGKD